MVGEIFYPTRNFLSNKLKIANMLAILTGKDFLRQQDVFGVVFSHHLNPATWKTNATALSLDLIPVARNLLC